MNVPPELWATNAIATYHKNLVEFCRIWQNNGVVRYEALDASIDLLRLNLVVFETLAEERRHGTG